MKIACISIRVSIQDGVRMITQRALVHKDIIKETTRWTGNAKGKYERCGNTL